ncbi:MAG: hypothetical protein ACOCRO_02270 [Halanaerobiales bacterium]
MTWVGKSNFPALSDKDLIRLVKDAFLNKDKESVMAFEKEIKLRERNGGLNK